MPCASPSHQREQGARGLGYPGFFGFADYLFWTVRDKHLEFGIAGDLNQQDDGARGDVLTLGDEWDSGIRGVIGYRLGCCGPDIRFRYTGFEQEDLLNYVGNFRATLVSSDNGEEDDNDDINTLGGETVFLEDLATGAAVIYELDYETFDFEFGQTFQINNVLNIRAHSGARIATIDELEQVTYSGGDFCHPLSCSRT